MLGWVLGFVGFWWVLAEGRLDGWPVALVAALVAVEVRRRLGSPGRRPLRPAGVTRFLSYFLWESLRGGADVALRAVRPELPIDPDLVRYRFRIRPGPARHVVAGALSLLPGTFTAELGPHSLTIHSLDRDARLADRVARLESLVAAAFGESVEEPGGEGGQ